MALRTDLHTHTHMPWERPFCVWFMLWGRLRGGAYHNYKTQHHTHPQEGERAICLWHTHTDTLPHTHTRWMKWLREQKEINIQQSSKCKSNIMSFMK
jgi:hypothetical protein